MDELGRVYEEIKVLAKDLVDRVSSLIQEGNVRRIIIKDDQGVTFMEIPLSVATLGVIVAPVLAAVGAVATLLSNFTVVVERAQRGTGPSRPATASAGAGSGYSATEDQVSMKDTVAQRVDNKGTKIEDLGGDGQHDSRGG
jgi:hypothetical protein